MIEWRHGVASGCQWLTVKVHCVQSIILTADLRLLIAS